MWESGSGNLAATLLLRPEVPAAIIGHFVDRRTGVVDFSETIRLVDLDPKTAGALQEVAWDTVSGRAR